jgi:hypothetical protein
MLSSWLLVSPKTALHLQQIINQTFTITRGDGDGWQKDPCSVDEKKKEHCSNKFCKIDKNMSKGAERKKKKNMSKGRENKFSMKSGKKRMS